MPAAHRQQEAVRRGLTHALAGVTLAVDEVVRVGLAAALATHTAGERFDPRLVRGFVARLRAASLALERSALEFAHASQWLGREQRARGAQRRLAAQGRSLHFHPTTR